MPAHSAALGRAAEERQDVLVVADMRSARTTLVTAVLLEITVPAGASGIVYGANAC